MLLRRLTQNKDISALQTLVSVVEPVKEYRRYQVRPQTMLSPLSGLVDAAQADAPGARRFNKMIDEMLADKDFAAYSTKIRQTFTEWREAGTELEPIIANSPALAETKPLAADLEKLGEIGQEAFFYLEKNAEPTAEWRDKQLSALAQIAKSKAALEFAVLSGVKKLVVAASEMPNRKTAQLK